MAKGIPSTTVRDLTLDPEQRISLIEKIPNDIKSQFQIQSILSRCCNEAARIGLRMMTEDRERALDIVLRVHEREFANVCRKCQTACGWLCIWLIGTPAPQSSQAQLSLLIGSITIQALHFFKTASSLAEDQLLIAKLASNVCEWIEQCYEALNSGLIHYPAVPFYYLYSMLTSYSVLLRLLKVPLFSSKVLDLERGASALHKGIEILKGMSLQENDTAFRSVTILQQLWQSKKAYLRRNADTNELEPVPLRIRSRIAMCHLLDTWAWWREEFGGPGQGYSGVWPPPLQASTKTKEVNGTAIAPSEPQESGDVSNGPADPARAPTMDLSTVGTLSMYQPQLTPSTAATMNDFTNLSGFAQAQLDPNFGNLIGDDMFSDLWSYWPDSHNWTTGLT